MKIFISVMTEGEITVLQNFSDDLHNKQSDAYQIFTAGFSSVVCLIHLDNSDQCDLKYYHQKCLKVKKVFVNDIACIFILHVRIFFLFQMVYA